MTSEEMFPQKRSCLLGLLIMTCYTAVVYYFSKSVSEVLQWCILPMIFLYFMGMLERKPPPRLHDSAPDNE